MKFERVKIGEDEAYLKFSFGGSEFVNPVELYQEYQTKKDAILLENLLLGQAKIYGINFPIEQVRKICQERAQEEWIKDRAKIDEIEIPEEFKKLLNSSKKREQVKLLKGFSLTPFELQACIIYAFESEGYLFSQYEGNHDPPGYNAKDKPQVAILEEGDVTVIGDTKYTKGELKQLINQRKKTISKFIDREDEWHCFFLTFNSLRGMESWKGGQPHFHYISDKFGIPRSEVVKSLKSRKYKLGNLPHVDLHGMPE